MEVSTLDYLLGIGGLLAQVISLIFLLAFFFKDRRQSYAWPDKFLFLAGAFGLWASFFISLFGTILTFYYSEVLGVLPCGLCWLQRAFLYPQVILFGIALWKGGGEEKRIADYAIGLSLAGASVALYHHYLQMGGSKLAPCISSLISDCSTPTMMEFGYITYPLLSFLSFILIILFMIGVKSNQEKQ
ncbi:MAG: disulfide bond formation protein B [Patescibacteria group bacterium]